MTQWSLSALSPVDIDPILDIEGRSFSWPWGRLSFEGEADSPGAGSWVVRTPGPTGAELVVAYIFFRLIADEVHISASRGPGRRRRESGHGPRRVLVRLSAVRAVALIEVRPSSTEALALYRRLVGRHHTPGPLFRQWQDASFCKKK
jgi:ribosomal protein S18 acetylase RimI-like enzyme